MLKFQKVKTFLENKMHLKKTAYMLLLATSLYSQEWKLPNEDLFYFGVEAGASYNIAYDWSFSWRKGIDVDNIAKGIEAEIGLSWGKEYRNGFIWGINFSYGYDFFKGRDNTITSKIKQGDTLSGQTIGLGGILAGMIFLPSNDSNFLPSIQIGVDYGLLFQGVYKGGELMAFGVSPAFGLRGGFSAIINQDYQIDFLFRAPVGSLISDRFGISLGFKKLFW